MRRRDIQRSNRNFLMGTAAMALVVLMAVTLFWYWCLP